LAVAVSKRRGGIENELLLLLLLWLLLRGVEVDSDDASMATVDASVNRLDGMARGDARLPDPPFALPGDESLPRELSGATAAAASAACLMILGGLTAADQSSACCAWTAASAAAVRGTDTTAPPEAVGGSAETSNEAEGEVFVFDADGRGIADDEEAADAEILPDAGEGEDTDCAVRLLETLAMLSFRSAVAMASAIHTL
jgi:hypothetical protein